MRVRKSSLALATIFVALAGASVLDGASAGFIYDGYFGHRGGFNTYFNSYSVNRTPQQRVLGAMSRPSNRDMRAAPSMGGRGMRGMGGSRMNGGTGRR